MDVHARALTLALAKGSVLSQGFVLSGGVMRWALRVDMCPRRVELHGDGTHNGGVQTQGCLLFRLLLLCSLHGRRSFP